MKLHPKVLRFANEMQNQLDINSHEPHKSNWEEFKNILDIVFEIEYHKSKLFLAIKENDLVAIKEYVADTANCLMFLGNVYSLYDNDDLNSVMVQMKSGIFNHVSINTPINHTKSFSTNIKESNLSS